MRKLIVCNIISLDGYFEGPGGDVMAMPFDHGFSEYNAERLRAADTLLLGRTSYEGFRSYWPAVADDPEAPPLEREISRRNNEIDKMVVSDTLTPDPAAPWHDNTRVVARAEAHDRIAELKKGPGRDILVFGSRTLWNDLLAHGLVDELHLMIGPGVIGAGTRAFENGAAAPLRLLGTRTWDNSGLVLVAYAVEPARAR
ncbi:dihydrofolate reductase family protein [Streptomyces sp. NPDC002867]